MTPEELSKYWESESGRIAKIWAQLAKEPAAK